VGDQISGIAITSPQQIRANLPGNKNASDEGKNQNDENPDQFGHGE